MFAVQTKRTFNAAPILLPMSRSVLPAGGVAEDDQRAQRGARESRGTTAPRAQLDAPHLEEGPTSKTCHDPQGRRSAESRDMSASLVGYPAA